MIPIPYILPGLLALHLHCTTRLRFASMHHVLLDEHCSLIFSPSIMDFKLMAMTTHLSTQNIVPGLLQSLPEFGLVKCRSLVSRDYLILKQSEESHPQALLLLYCG